MKKKLIFEVESGSTDCENCPYYAARECHNHVIDCHIYDLNTLNLLNVKDDNPMDNSKSINWEQRRFELVKTIAQGFYANPKYLTATGNYIMNIPETIILAADAVLEKYKEFKNV